MTEHWWLEQDQEGIGWLHFNQQKSLVNTLSSEVLEQLERHLIAITDTPLRGLIIVSDKRTGFCAGADVKAFSGLRDAQEVARRLRRVHAIFSRLEKLEMPTLALIHGFCLGGGLELALACRYRIARDDAGTRLGFPEVRLGIFPGFGGSVRSSRLLGALRAMDLMLTGRGVSARKAASLGLVDSVVPARQLHDTARLLLRQPPNPIKPSWWLPLAASTPARQLIAAILRRRTAEKVNVAHYPAPYALIDHWRAHGADLEAMYASEARKVSKLITGPTAQNLIRLFLLQERLKSLGKTSEEAPQHVHVIGGGSMGGDIAAWCALKGLRVTLQDRGPEHLTRAIKRAHSLFRRRLKQPRLVRAAADRLQPDSRGNGIAKAELVIEAIFEDVPAKQFLFQEIEARLRPDALLASNTSSILIETLSERMARPERLVGLHFFNPVARMQLVEIVHGADTKPEMVSRAAAFVRRVDRLPLPVKSTPGFLVNRILLPYLLEAVRLLEEGVAPEQIDQAALDFGMPMGPIELADSVGLDICLSVAEKLADFLHTTVPELLRLTVAAGNLGRKSGRGFYRYQGKGPVKARRLQAAKGSGELAERMILRLLNESIACLREAVVEDADLLDAGVVFGTGFAPFRGGPIHYIRESGWDRIRDRLQQMEQQHGKQFSADRGWEAFA